jgi:hypothetical protein
MRFSLFKLRLEGIVAVINLGLVGVVLLTFLIAFPEGVVDQNTTSRNGLLLDSTLDVLLAILTFPVEWLTLPFTPMDGAPFTALIFVPLNTYFWGYVTAAIVRRYKARRGKGNTAPANPE